MRALVALVSPGVASSRVVAAKTSEILSDAPLACDCPALSRQQFWLAIRKFRILGGRCSASCEEGVQAQERMGWDGTEWIGIVGWDRVGLIVLD